MEDEFKKILNEFDTKQIHEYYQKIKQAKAQEILKIKPIKSSSIVN